MLSAFPSFPAPPEPALIPRKGLLTLSATKFGRLHVAEPPSSLARLHFHRGESELKPVAHPPRIPVLDQEDLIAQGIDTSELVPGAPKADSLGSCVANATTAALAGILPEAKLTEYGITQDPAADEKFAIKLYHALTMETGNPASEWPPEDCGSSGVAVCQMLETTAMIAGHKIAHGAENIVSLMQDGGLIVGQPWLAAWMTPDDDGFIDGDGSLTHLAGDIAGGVVGGHETYWHTIENVQFDLLGRLDLQRTTIRFRNSWSTSWGADGDGRAHLSTFAALGHWCDFRQLHI